MSASLLLLSFLGFAAPTLLGIFAVAGALTVGLYILRLRRRQVEVPFLDLWEKFLKERKATALRSRLQRLLSLLLSLLLVLGLVLALGDPRAETEANAGRSLVILLDVSASMGEKEAGRTRLFLAKQKIKTWLQSLGEGDRVLLVEMGAQVRPLTSFTSSARDLSEALSEARVLEVSADLGAGLRLARSALRGASGAQIILVSDGALKLPSLAELSEMPPLAFEPVVTEGAERSRENVAITAFSARRYALSLERFEVLLEVENLGQEQALVELSLLAAQASGLDGGVIDVKKLKLAPGERFTTTYQDLAQAEEGLVARVRRLDGVTETLSADDEARALLSPRQPVRLLIVGAQNNFLEAALLVDESLSVSRVEASEYAPARDFDVTIFDGVSPKREARTGAAIYLGAPPREDSAAGYPLSRTDKLENFGFDSWKEDSPLFRNLDPYNVQVLTGYGLSPEPSDEILGRSGTTPIFVHGERAEGAFLALGFSPRDSDFVLRPVWPLFVQNALEFVFPRARGEAAFSLRTGTVWRTPAPKDAGAQVEIVGPLGAEPPRRHTVPVEAGRAVMFGQRAGFYEIVSPAGKTRLAASLFGGEESRLLPTSELKFPLPEQKGEAVQVAKVEGMEPRSERPLWMWLVLFVFGASFLEWWTFHRRWTV